MSRAQGVIERIEKEFEDFKKDTIESNSVEQVFEKAYEIDTKSVAREFIIDAIDYERSNLFVYERMENILESYYEFHMGSTDGAITEETVEEFEEYMLAELKSNTEEEPQETLEEDRKIVAYSELSDEAKKIAYQEALNYIESEFANDEEVLNDKEKHAKDEAENCAKYYEDGSFAELI